MPKVLIIEDNKPNQRLFTMFCESVNLEVIIADNGREGVEKADKEMPDLILMDIQMPEMDGITAMKRIKENEKTRSIPIIALTSYAMKGDREKFLEEGFDDYLEKPVEKDCFIKVVKKRLGMD
jgi:two-component system cell cycle response regulator DivK